METSIENLKALGSTLQDLRAKIEVSQTYLDNLKDERSKVQNDFLSAMAKSGLKSIKTDDNLFSVTEKINPYIADPAKVIEEIKKRNLEDTLMPRKIDGVVFGSFARELYKQGEILEGVEMKKSSYISIKSNK